MGNQFKVGPKHRHIAVPDGWDKIDGDTLMIAADMVANIYTAKWEHVYKSDIGESADTYDLVIREKI